MRQVGHLLPGEDLQGRRGWLKIAFALWFLLYDSMIRAAMAIVRGSIVEDDEFEVLEVWARTLSMRSGRYLA